MYRTAEGIEVNGTIIKELSENLREKNFKVTVINDEDRIVEYIHQLPNDGIIGLGDSITTCTLKIRNILAMKGTLIYYGWNGDINYNRSLETFDAHPVPDYFLTRINYITLKGEILLKDYSRSSFMAGTFPRRIIAFAGHNRIVGELKDPQAQKYSVFRRKPENVDFTVVLLPNLNY